ncbi:hypothetical protein SAMN05444278_101490 [Psychroflexus salarius]|uniref:Uncharacterized protein n=2 Tax=Psychroflexus salarius TaxID=1155689 RepID=A0A1M4T4N6_9FLAO|nr:hypothetical protein SAMN05444278_101490 [Psychroflexus salarius]
MMLAKTNLQSKLERVRNRDNSGEKLLDQIKTIFDQVEDKYNSIQSKLNNSDDVDFNDFDLDLLESKNVYHISHIQKICIDYRLRFLDSSYFKNEIPFEAIQKIKNLEQEHETELKGFKIMAPSKLFKLENADDPLLFAPIGNGYYYLIHKWGNDLSPFRKLAMWPFKCFENFMLTVFITALLTTSLVPNGFFMDPENSGTEFFLLFIFMFKWIGGVALYYGFAKGKNFNEAIWKSKYYNA